MQKTNDIQKKVCETIITQCKFWMSSNDINSPTNMCGIQETVDNIEELDDSENVKLVVALENILELLRNLDDTDENFDERIITGNKIYIKNNKGTINIF
jgi:hypothetical protein